MSKRLCRYVIQFFLVGSCFCWVLIFFSRVMAPRCGPGLALRFLKAATNFKRLGAMALQAKGAHIRKVALPTTFNDRDDVIGIPQAFSTAQVPLGGSAKTSAST